MYVYHLEIKSVCYPETRELKRWVNSMLLKVIRKFFLNHNKIFRWHLGDYEKHIFSHLKACERRNFDFCVFLRMCSMPVTNRFI